MSRKGAVAWQSSLTEKCEMDDDSSKEKLRSKCAHCMPLFVGHLVNNSIPSEASVVHENVHLGGVSMSSVQANFTAIPTFPNAFSVSATTLSA
jgi:aromatic ring-opening dioxygenase catalytic subunit (LigB family)